MFFSVFLLGWFPFLTYLRATLPYTESHFLNGTFYFSQIYNVCLINRPLE